MSAAIERFEIRVDDAVLDDLRRRLAHTRFPDQIEGTGWEYGISVDYLRELVEYWREHYDWRAQEARLNELAHFRTCIDGQSIHFIHALSARTDAFPLLIMHGWPGSRIRLRRPTRRRRIWPSWRASSARNPGTHSLRGPSRRRWVSRSTIRRPGCSPGSWKSSAPGATATATRRTATRAIS